MILRITFCVAGMVWPLAAGVAAQGKNAAAGAITWKKTVVDKAFRAEGAAVADVNKDGKMDIIVGDVWYEAPDYAMHVLRKDKRDAKKDPQPWDPAGYSESFACFADDFNGDGWPDVIVIPFPGKPCYWYENPQGKPVLWKEHLLTNSACNETPIYVDLLGIGKRVLVMGWRPSGKGTGGEVCYFRPGKDPTRPWERYSISGPGKDGKDVPGSHHFYHGLGAGDVNGDGRLDIIIPDGWYEQPDKQGGRAWIWQATKIGPACADMFALDIDGDGKNDVISSSAHQTGLWWFQQKPGKDGPVFVQHSFFPTPTEAAKLPKDHQLSAEEVALLNAINKVRASQRRAPWKIHPKLCAMARAGAIAEAKGGKESIKSTYPGAVAYSLSFGGPFKVDDLVDDVFEYIGGTRQAWAPNLEVGIGVDRPANGGCTCVFSLGDRQQFALFSQSHALHLVDINGDGLKDLVTGRRWWAHGPNGDDTPADPPYLYWFEAKRDKTGLITFTPHLIDDDSGIGTQFTVADINGDGLLDVIIGNKRGVFVFAQVRTEIRKD